ncbi:MAG: hypothetical protein Ct9H300mP22_3860 [Gammaproteobacteria bacterium]|nr:MAG: hypothetical protein Ct9H300mP22_3860 [Gammaproteobacteria bacterium]
MGSEGYFINEFIPERTKKRTDKWGGSYKNRIRLPLEVCRRAREAVGEDFIIIYRLSMLDLVEGGSTAEEVLHLGQALCESGVSIINTGIGWHKATIPTIATKVPRAAFTWVTAHLIMSYRFRYYFESYKHTGSCRRNTCPRRCRHGFHGSPLLADANFVVKAKSGKADAINTCIACNQACLDHIFNGQISSCLVNPRACHELELQIFPTNNKKKIAVIGAGPAGLAQQLLLRKEAYSHFV